MQPLNSASSVKLSLRGKVCGVGLFLGIENTKIDNLFADTYLGPPLSCPGHPANAGKAGRVVTLGSDIFSVDLDRGIPKVFDSIVVPDSVPVVDNTGWPFSVVKEPRNAMGEVPAAIDVKIQIPLRWVLRTSNIANLNGPRKAYQPRNNSSFRVIAEKFSGTQGRKCGFHTKHSSMEASRADTLGAGLEACYAAYDGTVK